MSRGCCRFSRNGNSFAAQPAQTNARHPDSRATYADQAQRNAHRSSTSRCRMRWQLSAKRAPAGLRLTPRGPRSSRVLSRRCSRRVTLRAVPGRDESSRRKSRRRCVPWPRPGAPLINDVDRHSRWLESFEHQFKLAARHRLGHLVGQRAGVAPAQACGADRCLVGADDEA